MLQGVPTAEGEQGDSAVDTSDQSDEAGEQEGVTGEEGGGTVQSDAPLGLVEASEVVSWVDQSKVVVRLDVGGEVVHTSLATVMAGVRQGGEVFQKICLSLLGPGWEGYEAGGAVPAHVAAQVAVQVEFVDTTPRVFEFVLENLRSGELLSGDSHMLKNVRAWAARTGMEVLP